MADKHPLYVVAMSGMGDSIYIRPAVRELSRHWEVYLANPWPQFYADLPIHHVKHPLKLRTQEKNVARLSPDIWETPPRHARKFHLGYYFASEDENILSGLERKMGCSFDPLVFDLPSMGRSPVKASKPIAVIRPACERREWLNEARNPNPKYVAEAARILQERGYHIVSVADLDRGHESLYGPVPVADERYHAGELDVRQLMALVRDAAVVVGPVGWILPAALALHTPVILIAGGQGFYNRPSRLTDPRMDLSHVYWMLPEPFCKCKAKEHRCNKTIPGFTGQFERALDEVTADRLQAVA